MHRISLPGTDASLLVSPRWAELPPLLQVAILVLAFVVPLALVMLLYRYELRLIKPGAAIGLLALRLVVVVLILFLLGLQPVYARTHTEELPGRVLIAVDRSDSIGVTDPQRPPVEKLRLALALKVGGDVCPGSLLQDWIKQYDDTGDVRKWVADNEAPDDAARRRQLEAERREQFAEVCRRVDALTRSEVARRVLAEDGAGLLSSIAAKHKVEVIGFTQEAWDANPDALADLFKPSEGDQARARAAFTDLRLPLSRALERSGSGEGRVLGVVLLSDGQHNWGLSPVKKAIEMGEHKLPIYAVPLGARQPPPDIAVVSAKAPPAVFKDVDVQIEARVKVSGIKDRKQLVVQLQRPGEEPLEETIDHDGSDRYHTVRFQVRLDKPGTQALTVHAKPQEGETTTANNSRPVVINVADDKARVLLIDGEARWEQHYLANALARDRTMKPESVVFLQPRLGAVPEDDLRKAGNPARTLPTEPDALSAYDCIILGDVSPEQLTPAEGARLEKYVGDRGGTLVILAGKRAMPLAFTGANPGDESDPIARLLPIEQPQAVRTTAGFPVTLTYEGKSTPFLQMEPEPDRNEQRWAEFPRHFWGVVGKVKPGGTALAYVADAEPGGKRDEAERAKERGLIVRHNYGFGRVLFVGLDSTWRWRYRAGDVYHHRFWGQAIRWAAADKPLVTGNDFVRFGTRDAVYRHGQDVDLVVRLADEAGPLAPDAVAAARVLRQKDGPAGGEESVALVPLGRREAQPRVLEGKLRDLPAGHYAVELVIPDLGDKLNAAAEEGQPAKKLRAAFSVTPPDGEEMVELATNYPLLEELAAKSGGQVFAAENTAGLVEALSKRAVVREERAENRLWQWWVMLVLVLSLLTAEWAGRKFAGLP
jgi:hypothetical protein